MARAITRKTSASEELSTILSRSPEAAEEHIVHTVESEEQQEEQEEEEPEEEQGIVIGTRDKPLDPEAYINRPI